MNRDFISKNKKGFSTLELMIAMFILILVVSAVILVSFGSQSTLIDSQTNNEALNKAQELLESAQANARKDFNLANPIAEFIDGIYQKKVEVTQQDLFTKKVTAKVSWLGEHNRDLSVQLSSLVTNFENAVGGDTCSSVLTGDWKNPNIVNFSVSNVDSDSSLSIDTYNHKIFFAISDAYASSASTIFVYNLADPANPSLLAYLDNDPDVKAGVSDLQVTDKYLYVAKATGTADGQLQIFDISTSLPVKVGYDFKISGVTGDDAIGKSIFYKDGYIYLGLAKTESGPEFNIIDVHGEPNNFPEVISPVGGYQVGHAINDIYVKGKYAYLATSDVNRELIILDISNPANPIPVSGTMPNLSGSYGKSLYLVGDRLYFGRTYTGGDEFYIFNVSNLEDSVSILGNQETTNSVNDLIVRDYLAFLVTTSGQFQIWQIDEPSNIIPYFDSSVAGNGFTLDCEGNYLYAGSLDSADNKAYLSVITAP
jgi:Tfp pilus assembly protein PilV